MKIRNFAYIIGLILAISIIFNSCDVIEPPYRTKPINGGDTTKKYRKILIEDFTGQHCKECPEAADLIKELHEVYKDRLIAMAIHSGYYAKPKPPTYPYDFRTSEGTEIDNYFGVNAVGNPNGMVNRRIFDGSRIVGPTKWGASIQEFLNEEASITLNLTASYNSSNKEIKATIEGEYLKQGTADHHLAVFIVEDSVVQYQIDKRKTPADIPDYVHNHALRASMNNSAWGEKISDTDISAGFKFTKNYSYTIAADKDWRPEKLKIIAYVHDKGASYEILQVEEIPVIK